MRRRAVGLRCVAAGSLLLVAASAFAQDAPVRRPADPSDPDFVGAVLGDSFSGPKIGDERVIYAVGGRGQPVWIRQPGFELRCESVVIWGTADEERLMDALQRREVSPDDAVVADAESSAQRILGPVLHAVYAEGEVFLKRGRQTIRAERVLVDFQKGHAFMVDAELSGAFGRAGGKEIPLSVRAGVVRGVAENRYRAEDATFTTVTQGRPHWAFSTSSLEVDFTQEYVGFETGWWPQVRASTLVGDDTPILVLPKMLGRTFEVRPLRDIDIGSSSRFGTKVGLIWGDDLKNADDEKVGSWRLHTDHLTRRGNGIGTELRFEGDPAGPRDATDEAWIDAFYQHDTAGSDGYSERPFDGLVGGGTPDDRGRIGAGFRYHGRDGGLVPEGWRLDGQLGYWSDRGYIPEYERALATTKKQQETFLSARRIWGNEGVSILASYRLNGETAALARDPIDLIQTDYAVESEYLPSVTYHVINEPILGVEDTGFAPLNLSVQASAAQARLRYDDLTLSVLDRAIGYRPERILRGDVETRVTAPFDLGPVHVNPAFGGSFMGVDETNGFATGSRFVDDDGSEDRYSGFWGLRLGSEVHRLYDVNNTTLGLNGLRHVISADTQYFDRFEVSDVDGTFQVNDLIDELDEVQIGTVRLRNRLQTKRDGEIVDWIDVETRFLHFFDEFRAQPTPLSLRQDLPMPLQRLDFPGEDRFAGQIRDGASYHQHRVRWRVLPELWLVGEGDYDMQDRAWETTLGGARWFMSERLSVYVGRRTIVKDSRIWTLRGDYQLSNKWAVSVQQQENTRNDERFDTRVTLRRRAHDYTIALELDSDNQLDETSISFALYPSLWLGSKKDAIAVKPLDYAAKRWYR